ncbi:LacI family DNA-binding transcriptional regulator [Cohnella sp. CFH 77786]|uniref:LacI family DNA-binding transcriptional regulator n=1 Tax=Cohnella sp. CFH 77786 TaxID=2662265 RepID=UPI001C60FE72|nr:LacI family DNA-binding transcriptional regulator [Cohnella sp. CFH 77786]MBW5447593.1 LacI family DNA-binding transcriptional regulator [Cohnella sp. CFH 77786]
MSSIKQVADRAGVAVGTVSRVINNHPAVKPETRDKVLAAIEELQYIPNEVARNFKMQKSNIVALLLPTIWHPFFSELAYYIEDELDRNGYKLILCNSDRKPEKELYYFETLNQNKAAGIIGITYNDIQNRITANIPMVTIDRHVKEEISCVTSDNYAGGRTALAELVGAGANHPAYLGFISQSYAHSEVDLRKQGFTDAAKERGMPIRIYEIPSDEDLMETSFAKLFASEEFRGTDGLFANGDLLAARYVKHAREHRIRVPEDVKVIGYDGIQNNDCFHPVLSTIRQPVEEMARTSVQLLIRRIEGEELKQETYRLPVHFRKGETT